MVRKYIYIGYIYWLSVYKELNNVHIEINYWNYRTKSNSNMKCRYNNGRELRFNIKLLNFIIIFSDFYSWFYIAWSHNLFILKDNVCITLMHCNKVYCNTVYCNTVYCIENETNSCIFFHFEIYLLRKIVKLALNITKLTKHNLNLNFIYN